MGSVFLSHSHSDKKFVRKLAADLRNRGHVVWIDEAEINVGDSLVKKIREGIDQVDYVAAVLSKFSVQSEWVNKELELASNREMEEGRVVVLPILLDKVALPGFLKGKLYADFTEYGEYEASLERLLRSIGGPSEYIQITPQDLANTQAELKAAIAVAQRHQVEAERARRALFRQKSDRLKTAINGANKKFPLHAPINIAYGFDVGSIPITLDYVLWAIAKSEMRGVPHQLEILITLENKWDDVGAMLEAYREMLDAMGNPE